MDIRALPYSADLQEDLLMFVCEDTLDEYSWPSGTIADLVRAQGFSGKSGEVASVVYLEEGSDQPRKVLVAGLGKDTELTLETVRKAIGESLKEAEKLNIERLAVVPWTYQALSVADVARVVTETSLLASYRFDRYLSEKKDRKLNSIQVCYEPELEVEVVQAIKVGQTLGETTNLARTLVNEPANFMTPERLAEQAVEAGEMYGFAVDVLEMDAIRELGMTAFLEVGKASVNKPRLIVMRHLGNPEQADSVIGLVGKGLTFDSGGLSLKQAQGMGDMKYDMAGAAAVIGAMGAIARENLPVNVVAVVAACENLISGEGYRPGDILTSMSGKTILIESTDAEGRLTLADAVHYVITKENASTVVDVATLTGAVIVALGDVATGVITNDQKLYEHLEQASEQSGERVWQLPSFPEYREQNKTPFADLKNTGGRGAGTVTAGLFVEAFVQGKPWMHLDIAGTAFASKDKGYLTQGATGVGVRLLYHFVEAYR